MTAMRYTPLVLALLLPACATRGNVRDAVEEQAAAQRAALESERTAREAADTRMESEISTLQADLNTLRNDLQSMRDEFGAQIAAVERGMQFVMPVHFGFDEATVRPQNQEALQRFAEVVNRHYTGALVTIEGFADPAGPAEYNMRLSQHRADAVREQLAAMGIQAELRAVGYGETRPVVEGAAAEASGAEMNRRVVFVIERP